MADTKTPVPVFESDESLRSIKSLEDVMQIFKEANVPVASYSEEFGTGFEVLSDKNRLVGVPFFILGMQFNEGKQGKFVSLHVITKSNEKLIVNDGSTGILAQCVDMYPKTSGVWVDKGLTRSDYKYVNKDTGEESDATTYYFAT